MHATKATFTTRVARARVTHLTVNNYVKCICAFWSVYEHTEHRIIEAFLNVTLEYAMEQI